MTKRRSLQKDNPSVPKDAPSGIDRKSRKRQGTLDETVADIHIKGRDILLTRRHLLYGAAGIGVVAVVGGVSYVASGTDAEPSVDSLEVPDDAVVVSTDFQEVDTESCMQLTGEYKLKYGTLVWANGDDVAACLVPTEGAAPLTQVSLLHLENGTETIVLEGAMGVDEGFEIYDVRATSSGIVWTEADILDGVWRIYTARIKDDRLQSITLMDSGDSSWETPTIAIAGSFAFWQVLPKADGTHAAEPSVLKRSMCGTSGTDIMYSSPGRMASPPYALDNSVVITPRTDTNTIHYKLVILNAEDGGVLDSCILPASMKPLDAAYGKTGFSFTFEKIYSYGGGISNLGTYTPIEHAENSSYNDAVWFRFARTPTAAPAWCKDYFMVKSTTAVCGFDFAAKTYFAFDVQTGSDDYGDFLASAGMNNSVVIYTNRDYTSIDSTSEIYCSVRVWKLTSDIKAEEEAKKKQQSQEDQGNLEDQGEMEVSDDYKENGAETEAAEPDSVGEEAEEADITTGGEETSEDEAEEAESDH